MCFLLLCVSQERIMELACEAWLLAYYLLGEPDLLRHCIYRSGGHEEQNEDNF